MKAKEPYFWWRKEWYEYMKQITSTVEAVNFARTVAVYGLYGKDANLLCGDDLCYFNEVVRPDLDKQRKKMRNKQWKKQK